MFCLNHDSPDLGLPDYINSRFFLAVTNQEILQSFNQGSDFFLLPKPRFKKGFPAVAGVPKSLRV